MALNAQDILAAEDLPTETVDVPEWNGKVIIRGLTSAERDAYERQLVNIDKRGQTSVGRLDNVRALLVVRCLVDEKGERLFRDAQARELGAKSAAVMDRLSEVCMRLSGMTVEQREGEAEGFAEAQDDDDSLS